jgi:uncharacterized membrane protein
MRSADDPILKTIWHREKPLIVLMLLMFVMYSVLCILRHLHFQTSTRDFGNFDQMVWHYSRLEAPGCTDLGLRNSLGDHFSPILALCAPLFWIWPHAETLLVAQSFLFALSLLPIFLFSEKRIGRQPAYLLAISFIFFWGVQHTIEYEFHPDVFAVPLIASAIYFIDVKKWGWASFFVFSLLLVKEDLTLLVAFFGIYLMLNQKIKLGCLFLLTGILFFYLEVMVWVPHFHVTEGNYHHWIYTELGQQPSDSIKAILKNPLLPFEVGLNHWEKIRTLLFLFGPFLFLPLYSRQLILMIPLIAAKELSSGESLWGMGFHYSATLCPILVMAAAAGLAHWRQKPLFKPALPKKYLSAPVIILIINIALIPILSPWRYIEHAKFWTFTDGEKTSASVFALIPPQASVGTQSSIAPHLSHRETIYSLGDDGDCHTLNPDFIVACRDLNSWPIPYSEVETCLNEKEKNGYKKIFDSNGWIVLKNLNFSRN